MEQSARIVNRASVVDPDHIRRFMLHNALFNRSPKNWTAMEAAMEQQREKARQVGTIHITFSKEALSDGHSIPVNSFETLNELEDHISHWTPQVYMWGGKNNKGRNQANVRFLTCVGVEIDQDITVEEIHYASSLIGLPSPALILSTPRGGKQWFYVFSKPFCGSKKARKAGRGIAKEIRIAFSEFISVDPYANPTGFFRFPSRENILFFSGETLDSDWALTWYKQRVRTISKQEYGQKVVNGSFGYTDSPCVRAILANTKIQGKKGKIGRNNAVFTLGLAFKADGYSIQKAYDILDEWNSNLEAPIEDEELMKTLHSAYKSEFPAPSRYYLETLSGSSMTYNVKYITPPKPREERQRSHYEEWESDLLSYIEEHCTPEQPFLVGSQRSIAKAVGKYAIGKAMGKNSLMDMLRKSNKFIVKVKTKSNGEPIKGRGARLYIASRRMILAANQLTFKKFLLSTSTSDELEGLVSEHQLKMAFNQREIAASLTVDEDPPGG